MRRAALTALLLVSLSACGPGSGEENVVRLPILMYHALEPASDGRFTVRLDEFLRTLDALRAWGFETVLPADLVGGDAALPDRPVMLTFDDAYRSHWEVVAPAMQERGMRGVFCVPTSYPDHPGAPVPSLTWSEVSALSASGHEIAGHGDSHANLAVIPEAELDVKATAEVFLKRLGRLPISFCYPKGQFRPGTSALVEGAGYRLAFTTIDEMETWPPRDPLHLRRLGVVGGKDSVVYRGDPERFLLARLLPDLLLPSVVIEGIERRGEGWAEITLRVDRPPEESAGWLQLLRLADPEAVPSPFLSALPVGLAPGRSRWRIPLPRGDGSWVARVWDRRGGVAWAERVLAPPTAAAGEEP